MDDLLELAISKSKKRLSQKSRLVYRSHWRRLCHELNLTSPRRVSKDELLSALERCGNYRTQQRMLMLFRLVAENLVEMGLNLGSAYEAVEPMYRAKEVPTHVTSACDEGLDSLLRACKGPSGWKHQRFRAMLAVLWETAPQMEELLALTWASVSFSSTNIAALRFGGGRGARRLELAQSSSQELRSWHELTPCPHSHDFVFVSSEKGEPVVPSTVWRQIQKVVPCAPELAGIEQSGVGLFRAALAARMLSRGEPFEKIQYTLGHARLGSTVEYLMQLRLLNQPGTGFAVQVSGQASANIS